MKILIMLTSLLILSKASGSIGHDQGNGGVIIKCPLSRSMLSLDYVMAKPLFSKGVNITRVDSTEESLQRIANLILHKLPTLSKSFNQFVRNVRNESDPTQPYLWKTWNFNPNLENQTFDVLPSVCSPQFARGVSVEIMQVMWRIETPSMHQTHVLFYYDPTHINRLSGVQRSFLFVHEWLWSISTDVAQNRKINYFLHSDLLEKMKTNEVRLEMRKYGVSL